MKAILSPIEILESRIAPAAIFVSTTTATYDDVDGDHVTVKFSKPVLTAGTVDNVVQVNGSGQLTLIDLTSVAALAQGTSIAFAVTVGTSGDGVANVGRIDASGIDLGAVTVKGDLGAIDAGDSTASTAGVKSLSVLSLGRLGTSTGAPDLESDITGSLGSLVVKGDVTGAWVNVTGGGDAKIGAITIGGALIGGTSSDTGEISSSGDIGPVKIGGDIQGNEDMDTGLLKTSGKLASATIGGSLVGGGFTHAGEISSGGDMGAVKIGGRLQGGTGTESGSIISGGKIAAATVGNSLMGGSNVNTGIISSVGAIGSVTVGGSLIGGSDQGSGASGAILSGGDLGAVKIAGDIMGGVGQSSGYIQSEGKIATVTIGGSLIGGSVTSGTTIETGTISSFSSMGAVKIAGNIVGGSVSGSGSLNASGDIIAEGSLASLFVGGSILAGSNTSSGTLLRSGSIEASGEIGSLTVLGSLVGAQSGGGFTPVLIAAIGVSTAASDMTFGKISIGGRVEHADILAGYELTNTVPLASSGDAQIGAVTVGGDWIASNLVAGAKNTTSSNVNFGDANDALIGTGNAAVISKIASITIGGQVLGTTASGDHFGFVAESIGTFKLGGTLIALQPLAHNDDRALTVGSTNDVAIHEV